MKYGWVVLVLLVAGFSAQNAAAQAAVYGEFSGTYMSATGVTTTTYTLYGATTGLIIEGPTWHHMVIAADLQGRFVRNSGTSMNGAAAGPRFTFNLKHGWEPYGEFLFGFSRFRSTTLPNEMGSTTDSEMQINPGMAKRVSPRWDIYAEYSYSQYYAFGGAYNPKTFGAGAIFHFAKR